MKLVHGGLHEVQVDSNSFKEVPGLSAVQLSIGNQCVEDIEDGTAVGTQTSWRDDTCPQQDESDNSRVDTPLPLRRSNRIRKSNTKYANEAITEDVLLKEPETFEEAIEKSVWNSAKEEIVALERNQTLVLVSKPNDVKPISCKWVYKIKRYADGIIERYKACLVVVE